MSRLLEDILSITNMNIAKQKVKANKGSAGVDGVTVDEIDEYMAQNEERVKEEIRARQYKPQPVLRVEIPKPNGGVRKLGISTVLDRIILQAVAEKLTPIFDPLFSSHSYGFRPGRSAHQAITELCKYLNDGYTWIVDLDLEKFFDNIPQDRLMSLVGRVIHDGDTESLIRKYLKAGVINEGVFEDTTLGVSQGSNLSPLLANVMLNELDRELEKRGLHFVRYADDCVIATRSEASAKRVMESITRFIEDKLGLKVNAEKSHVCRPSKLKYLGYSFYFEERKKLWLPKPHDTSVEKFKAKLKELCQRNWSVSIDYRFQKLNEVIRGWINYFSLGVMKAKIERIDAHLRTMIRTIIWKQWKVPSKRQWGLQKLGVSKDLARVTAYVGDRYQFVALKTCVSKAISKQILIRRGLISCVDYYMEKSHYGALFQS